jgi:hypothetical protein
LAVQKGGWWLRTANTEIFQKPISKENNQILLPETKINLQLFNVVFFAVNGWTYPFARTKRLTQRNGRGPNSGAQTGQSPFLTYLSHWQVLWRKNKQS